jgi:hypothetical protein
MNERDIKSIQSDAEANYMAKPESRQRPYWKLAVFLLSLILPGYIVSMYAWGILGVGLLGIEVRDTVSAETAAAYEEPVRDALAPLLSEKYGLGEFEVRYTRPGQFILGHRLWDTKESGEGSVTIRVYGVNDWTQGFELAKDIARMKREQPRLPHCLYVLNFWGADREYPSWTPENAAEFPDHAIHGELIKIAIPDAAHGYAGERKSFGERWHTDDFTPTEYDQDPHEVKR